MKLSDIRCLFSKAVITISKSYISAKYLYRGRWFTQEIEDKRYIFIYLLENSYKFGIKCTGRAIELTFLIDSKFNEEIYYPIESEMSVNEINKLLKESMDESVGNDEFFEFINGVDLSSNDLVIDLLDDLVKEKENKLVDLKLYSKWISLLNCVNSLQKYLPVYIEYETPNDNIGFVEVQIPEGFCGWLSQDAVNELINILYASSMISLEGSVDDGYLNIIFGVKNE